jgi:hypothetical protein
MMQKYIYILGESINELSKAARSRLLACTAVVVAWDNVVNMLSGKNAFKECGLFPFDPSKQLRSHFVISDNLLTPEELTQSDTAKSRGGISGRCITEQEVLNSLKSKYALTLLDYSGCVDSGDREIRFAATFRSHKVTDGRLLSRLPATISFLPSGLMRQIVDP